MPTPEDAFISSVKQVAEVLSGFVTTTVNDVIERLNAFLAQRDFDGPLWCLAARILSVRYLGNVLLRFPITVAHAFQTILRSYLEFHAPSPIGAQLQTTTSVGHWALHAHGLLASAAFPAFLELVENDAARKSDSFVHRLDKYKSTTKKVIQLQLEKDGRPMLCGSLTEAKASLTHFSENLFTFLAVAPDLFIASMQHCLIRDSSSHRAISCVAALFERSNFCSDIVLGFCNQPPPDVEREDLLRTFFQSCTTNSMFMQSSLVHSFSNEQLYSQLHHRTVDVSQVVQFFAIAITATTPGGEDSGRNGNQDYAHVQQILHAWWDELLRQNLRINLIVEKLRTMATTTLNSNAAKAATLLLQKALNHTTVVALRGVLVRSDTSVVERVIRDTHLLQAHQDTFAMSLFHFLVRAPPPQQTDVGHLIGNLISLFVQAAPTLVCAAQSSYCWSQSCCTCAWPHGDPQLFGFLLQAAVDTKHRPLLFTLLTCPQRDAQCKEFIVRNVSSATTSIVEIFEQLGTTRDDDGGVPYESGGGGRGLPHTCAPLLVACRVALWLHDHHQHDLASRIQQCAKQWIPVSFKNEAEDITAVPVEVGRYIQTFLHDDTEFIAWLLLILQCKTPLALQFAESLLMSVRASTIQDTNNQLLVDCYRALHSCLSLEEDSLLASRAQRILLLNPTFENSIPAAHGTTPSPTPLSRAVHVDFVVVNPQSMPTSSMLDSAGCSSSGRTMTSSAIHSAQFLGVSFPRLHSSADNRHPTSAVAAAVDEPGSVPHFRPDDSSQGTFLNVGTLPIRVYQVPLPAHLLNHDEADDADALNKGIESYVNQYRRRAIEVNELRNDRLVEYVDVMRHGSRHNDAGPESQEIQGNSVIVFAESTFVVKTISRGSQTLKTIMKQLTQNKDKLGVEVIKSYALEVLLGLSSLHEKGWVHGDIRAANVVVVDSDKQNNNSSKIRLTGILLLDNASRSPLKIREDYHCHAAPETLLESLNAAIAGQAKDVWAFGMLVLELILLSVDYMNYAILCGVSKQVHEQLTDQCSDPLLIDIVIQCLRLDPQRRPSVKELLEHDCFTTVVAATNGGGQQ